MLDTHPHETCPNIEAAYQQLVGVSIARGFGRQLTALFGGSKGCTHVGSLLRAMAPVAVQSMYSMQMAGGEMRAWNSADRSSEERERAQAYVRDSCHVWAADGDAMKASEAGVPMEAPIWIRQRLEALGRSEELDNWG